MKIVLDLDRVYLLTERNTGYVSTLENKPPLEIDGGTEGGFLLRTPGEGSVRLACEDSWERISSQTTKISFHGTTD